MTQYTIGNITFAPAPRISVRQLVDDSNTASGKSLRDVEIIPDQREIVARTIVTNFPAILAQYSQYKIADTILAALSKGVA